MKEAASVFSVFFAAFNGAGTRLRSRFLSALIGAITVLALAPSANSQIIGNIPELSEWQHNSIGFEAGAPGGGSHTDHTLTLPDTTTGAPGGILTGIYDQAYFRNISVREGSQIRVNLTSLSSHGLAGAMVRDSNEPDAAFVFVGKELVGQAEHVFVLVRREKGGTTEVIDLGEQPTWEWFKLVVGRSSVYVYSATADFDYLSSTPTTEPWDLQRAFEIQLTGEDDVGGAIVEEGTATFDHVIKTDPILWSEREVRVDDTNPAVTIQGDWSPVSVSSGAISAHYLEHPGGVGTETDFVEFPFTVKHEENQTRDYEIYVHCVGGTPSEFNVEVVNHGSATPATTHAGETGWIKAGNSAFNLANGAHQIRIYADPNNPVRVDAVKAVYVGITNWSGIGFTRQPTSRIGYTGSGISRGLKKIAGGSSNWNAGAYSTNAFHGDFVYQFRVPNNSHTLKVGVTDDVSGQSYGNLTYRFNFTSNNNSYASDGAESTTLLGYGVNPWFTIERTGKQINFRRNGNVILQSTIPSETPLRIDSSLRHENAQFKYNRSIGWTAPLASANNLDGDEYVVDAVTYDFTDDLDQWVIDGDPEDEIQSYWDVDPNEDLDQDLLPNFEEAIHDPPSNPTLKDTDGDGLDDYEEIRTYETDPTEPDSDEDGVSDYDEVHSGYGFDPNDANTDGGADEEEGEDTDGVGDWAEWMILKHDLNDPFGDLASVDGSLDFDGDGVTDLHESLDGTDPVNPDDFFFPVEFGRLGSVENAVASPDFDAVTGANATKIVRSGGVPSGGLSHHQIQDESRIRFRFSDTQKMGAVGFGYVEEDLILLQAGDVPMFAVSITASGSGKAQLLEDGDPVVLYDGSFEFPVTSSDLIEIRAEITPATMRFVVEKNQAEIGEIVPSAENMDHQIPMVAVVSLPDVGSSIEDARYRSMVDTDVDGDLLGDAWEMEIVNSTVGSQKGYTGIQDVSPGVDDDLDGLTNMEEFQVLEEFGVRSKGHLVDTDEDDLWDGWEVRYGLDPVGANNASGDLEAPVNGGLMGDGLTNLQEFENRLVYDGDEPNDIYSGATDPWARDTDEDGFDDKLETDVVGRNPAKAEEPFDQDSDGDGIWDTWERDNGLNIADPNDADDDWDLDQLTNLEEFLAGTQNQTGWKLVFLDPPAGSVAETALAGSALEWSRNFNNRGQVAFAEIDGGGDLRLQKWTRTGFESAIDLGDATGFTTVDNVLQNNLGMVVVPISTTTPEPMAELRIWQEGKPVEILDGNQEWIHLTNIHLTDSGVIVFRAVTLEGSKYLRWRRGAIEEIFSPQPISLIGVTERGELLCSNNGLLSGGAWLAAPTNANAISPHGTIFVPDAPLGLPGTTFTNTFYGIADSGNYVSGQFPDDTEWGGSSPGIYAYGKQEGEYRFFAGQDAFYLSADPTTPSQTLPETYDSDMDGYTDFVEDQADPSYSGYDFEYPGFEHQFYVTGANRSGDFVGWIRFENSVGQPEIDVYGYVWRDRQFTFFNDLVLSTPPANLEFAETRFLEVNDLGHILLETKVNLLDPNTGNFLSAEDRFAILLPDIDTDENGIADDWETVHGIPSTDPTDPFSLNGELQFALGLKPSEVDADNDLIADKWEVFHGLNPHNGNEDLSTDEDGDGLAWYDEWINGIDPFDSDSDDDGVSDAVELANGLNPTEVDSDLDGFTDYWELQILFWGKEGEQVTENPTGFLSRWGDFNGGTRAFVQSQQSLFPGVGGDGEVIFSQDAMLSANPSMPLDEFHLMGVFAISDGIGFAGERSEFLKLGDMTLVVVDGKLAVEIAGEITECYGLNDGEPIFLEILVSESNRSLRIQLNDFPEIDLDDSYRFVTDSSGQRLGSEDAFAEVVAKELIFFSEHLDETTRTAVITDWTTEYSLPWPPDPPTPTTIIDSDGDGMPDWWEKRYNLSTTVDDSGDDTDFDWASNLVEYTNRTDPTVAEDVEPDGMPDYWELHFGLIVGKDDSGDDPDTDGFTNIEEYQNETDPFTDEDTDNDGMPDAWENLYTGLDPLVKDGDGDEDFDLFTNLEEYLRGSNPNVVEDDDSDSMADGWEHHYGLDFTDPSDAAGDLDFDLATNLEEYQNLTNPTKVDTDGDGFPDWIEMEKSTDPTSLASVPTPDFEVGSQSGQLTTIAAAVASISQDGQIIRITAGEYPEKIDLSTLTYTVLVIGEGYLDTRIEGPAGNAALQNDGYGTTQFVSGLTLSHAFGDEGRGVSASYGSRLHIANTVIADNQFATNETHGLGVFASTGSIVRLENSVIAKNRNTVSGGSIVHAEDSEIHFYHVTVAENMVASSSEAIISLDQGALISQNSILWHPDFIEVEAIETDPNADPSSATVSYSVVADLDALGGVNSVITNCVSFDPWLNPNGMLTQGSIAIDLAEASTMPADIHGEQRPVGDIADIGADEFLDTDEDGLPDWFEDRYGLSKTNPNDADSLGLNGESYAFSYANGLDPNDVTSSPSNDTDIDGLLNSEESTMGTNPDFPDHPAPNLNVSKPAP